MSRAGRGKGCTGSLTKKMPFTEGLMYRIVRKRVKSVGFTERIFWSLLKLQKSSSIVGTEARFLFFKVMKKS